MLVAIVTAPFRPACATISASLWIDSGLALSTSCFTFRVVSLSEKACEASTDVVPTSTGRPDWCSPGNLWCYVDTDRCNDASGNYMMSSLSSYFPGAYMYYSYGTCGGARNTFESWVGSTTACTMQEAPRRRTSSVRE